MSRGRARQGKFGAERRRSGRGPIHRGRCALSSAPCLLSDRAMLLFGTNCSRSWIQRKAPIPYTQASYRPPLANHRHLLAMSHAIRDDCHSPVSGIATPMRRRPQSGFTLIEMLVAIVIFSIGMIGIALLQVKGMSYTKDAGSRSQATILARALADRMRSTMQTALRGPVVGNVDAMQTVDYRYPGSASCPVLCNATLQSAATADLAWAVTEITRALPAPTTLPRLTVTRPANAQTHTITIAWDETGVDQRIVFEVLPL